MNDLVVMESNGILVVDSREVARVLGVRHDNLLRDIDKYVENLTTSNLRASDFFIKSMYADNKGEVNVYHCSAWEEAYPEYEI